jgi:alkylhydroperoxidase family enzyme
MKLAVHTVETAPEAARPILEGIAADVGMVPNLAGTIAISPTLLQAFDGLRRAVSSGDLDPIVRETAGVAVGVAVDNKYGVAAHSTFLDRLGADGAEVDLMRRGSEPTDERLAAAYDFARQVVLQRGKVDNATVTRVANAGFSTAEILEIVAECTFAGLVGTIDNLAGRVELDAPLAPRAWAGTVREGEALPA